MGFDAQRSNSHSTVRLPSSRSQGAAPSLAPSRWYASRAHAQYSARSYGSSKQIGSNGRTLTRIRMMSTRSSLRGPIPSHGCNRPAICTRFRLNSSRCVCVCVCFLSHVVRFSRQPSSSFIAAVGNKYSSDSACDSVS